MNKTKLLSVLILSLGLTACIEKDKSSIPSTQEQIPVKSVLNTEDTVDEEAKEEAKEEATVESDVITTNSPKVKAQSSKEEKVSKEQETESEIIKLPSDKKKVETILETDPVSIEDIEILVPTKKELNSMK